MEAEDTILTQKEFEKAEKQGEWTDDYNPILHAQAEISFKAGRKEAAREIFEELEKYWSLHVPTATTYVKISRQDLQALKDRKW